MARYKVTSTVITMALHVVLMGRAFALAVDVIP
jgi:hypothetical protein